VGLVSRGTLDSEWTDVGITKANHRHRSGGQGSTTVKGWNNIAVYNKDDVGWGVSPKSALANGCRGSMAAAGIGIKTVSGHP
jgi:hypothetical protein